MANEPIIKGDNTIVWGCPTSGVTPSIGYLQSAKRKDTSEKAYIENESGNRVSTVLFNINGELTLEFIVKGNFTEPKVGDTVTALGKTGYCTGVEHDTANKSANKRIITAEFADTITIA